VTVDGTDKLIDELVTGLKPVRSSHLRDRLVLGIGLGIAISAVTMVLTMGLRPDFTSAVATGPFWIKFAFTGLFAGAGATAVRDLARPNGFARSVAIVGGLTVLAMLALAVSQLLTSPLGDYRRLVMGSTALVCPWLIVLLAIPILVTGLWTMRTMAPTRLTLAGTAVGLLAGSASAFVYAFSCDESAMPFVAIWYGLGIAITMLIGGAVGSRALRW
jgi:hypothetical protein